MVRYTPQQNGVAKRDNRTLVEGARTLFHSKTFLPLRLWAEAVNCVVYTLNRSLSSSCPAVTPFETWFYRKPDVSNLRPFGSEFYVMVPKELRQKLDAKCIFCYFVGNSTTQKGDRYWDPVSGKVNCSCDVSPIDHYYELRLPELDVQRGAEIFPSTSVLPVPHPPLPASASVGPAAPEVTVPPPGPRRSTRPPKPKVFTSMSAVLATTPHDQNRDAMSCADAPTWKVAIQQEYDSLIKNDTWLLVPLPANRSIIDSGWTFRIKLGSSCTPPIHKARFVAKGFSQVPGVDNTVAKLYAPVIKHDSLRVLLSVAAANDFELIQLDVKTAFLYGDLDEKLYVRQPEGFVSPGEEQFAR